ncbi:hypothetical protein CA264_01230 [Pontibacter actiniarum]|uniref:Uncharacterized protein n=1 Tax=Pontibacter actiniarum TaxID=323450 RepID=A0A1X9YMU5_9BACT|nr:hypothetical protein CA264_01230 [Pontibacter actiniarum]
MSLMPVHSFFIDFVETLEQAADENKALKNQANRAILLLLVPATGYLSGERFGRFGARLGRTHPNGGCGCRAGFG